MVDVHADVSVDDQADEPGFMARVDAVQARVAEVAGVLHGGYGALVELTGEALDHDLWGGWGLHSPAQWLAWRSGLSIARARQIVAIAKRRREVPTAVAALVAGELSVDQVRIIAAHVPARFEASATQLARDMTVAQMERTMPRHFFEEEDDEPAEDPPKPDEDPPPPAQAAADAPSNEERRRASWWWDDRSCGHLSATLPADEAVVLEAALKAARADLYAERRAEVPAGERVPWIGEAEAVLHLARAYLAGGRSARPGADRFLVHAHLDHDHHGTPRLRGHLATVLPDALRRLVCCDADVRPVWEREGTALSVGRSERIVPDRARRLIEHRDGGCVVPGCGRRTGLDVHHIVHWEDGGRTDTPNLCCLCRKHHRQHHLGLLGIAGDADRPGGLVITDRWDRPMASSGRSVPVPDGAPPEEVAGERGMPVPDYRPASGERMSRRDFFIPPDAQLAGSSTKTGIRRSVDA